MALVKLVLQEPVHLENKKKEKSRLVRIMQVIEVALHKIKAKSLQLLEEKPLAVKKVELTYLYILVL
jgi:hypothetical protein